MQKPLYYNVRPAKNEDGSRIGWADISIEDRRQMFRWFKTEEEAISHALLAAGQFQRPFDITTVYQHGRAEYVPPAPVTETHNAPYVPAVAPRKRKRKARKAAKRARKPARHK